MIFTPLLSPTIQAPWNANYKMYTYVTEELPALVESSLPTNGLKSITGHSMGGHGKGGGGGGAG